MRWKPLAHLQTPDWEYWNRCYPNGLGPSAFSSPAWQRLMEKEAGPPWRLMLLRAGARGEQAIHLPVLVKKDRWRRIEISTRPVAYYVTPIEKINSCCEKIVPVLLQAGARPLTSQMVWWNPPWCIWQGLSASDKGCKTCTRSSESPWCSLNPRASVKSAWMSTLRYCLVDTYLIVLNESAEEYLATKIQRAHRQHLRSNEREGLQAVHSPSANMVDEYFDLYNRVYTNRGWEGRPFSRDFFHEVNTTLGQGGELVVIRHKGKTVGGGVIAYDWYAAHLFQAAMDREVKGIHPHAMLYKIAIEQASKRGLRYVNLGGINKGNDGLRRYKEEWGAIVTAVPTLKWYNDAFARLRRTVTHATIWMKILLEDFGSPTIA